jgi:cytochrome c biogenesis protein CcdA
MLENLFSLLDSHTYIAFLAAFIAGSITAVAPCSLISVPLLVGSSLALNKDLVGRKKALYTYAFASLFALGVGISFSILGFMVAKFGAFFSIAPTWAYMSAGVMSLFIAAYAYGIIPAMDKSGIMKTLIRFRLFGGLLVGLVFGLVSTPCASAPLVAIIGAAANSSYGYAYALILTFALGHSLLLLVAGISVGFTQSIVSSALIRRISGAINSSFALLLAGFGFYFIYQAVLQF